MSNLVRTEQDAIDYISEKLSTILLHNQELDFSKLRSLSLLNGDISNKTMYYELIILSFVKYLKLSSTFQLEIKQDNDAYRVFNAMNLNDDAINSHFCVFLSLVAPDIINSLCVITSRLALDLANFNKTKHTAERVAQLEDKLNKLNFENPKDIEFASVPAAQVQSKQNDRLIRTKPVSLLEFLAPSDKKINDYRKSRRRSKTKTHLSQSTDEDYSIERYISNNRLPITATSTKRSKGSKTETASQTASRLFVKRQEYDDLTNLEDDIFPEASASVVLPSAQDIRKAKDKYSIKGVESSIDL